MSEKKQQAPDHSQLDGEFGIDCISDCETLHLMVLSSCAGVRLQFCQPVSFLSIPPEQALVIGQSLIDAANIMLELQKEGAEVH